MEKLESLFQFIGQKVDLREGDKDLIRNIVKHDKFQKGDQIVRLGQVCKSVKFVVTGIYRVFKNNDGEEITTYFSCQNRNPFVASFVSLLTQTPSNEIVECIEPGELITIEYVDWQQLYSKSQSINTFGRLMAEFNYVLAMERIEALQTHNATDRYVSFLKLYPNLINKIPHHYIASYVGVKPESLSRIRKEITNRKS